MKTPIEQNVFFEKFLKIENQFNLFSRKFRDIYYWALVRDTIYSELAVQLHIFQPMDWVGSEVIKKGIMKPALRVVKNLVGPHNPCHMEKSDILFFYAPRKNMTPKGYQSPMIDTFIDELENSYSILERSSSFMHFAYSINRTVYYNDIYDIRRILRFFILKNNFRVRRAAAKELSDIVEIYEQTFNVKISTDRIIDRLLYHVSCHHSCLKAYKSLLKRLGVKMVIEVCHYDAANFCMTRAAHELNIPVVELQHGIFSPYNLAYNFGKERNDKYLPDKIFCFGQYWADITRFPEKEQRLVVTGFPYFEERIKEKAQYSEQKNNINKKSILVVSSPKVSDVLIDTAIFLAENLPYENYNIIYKLHPRECNCWKEKYPKLAECSRIEVVDQPQYSIYQLFSRAYCQVGVSSLAIFEGIGYGVPAFIIKTQDYLDAVELCRRGLAILVESPDTIITELQKSSFKTITPQTRDMFWKENSVFHICEEIKKVLYSQEVSV